MPNLEIYHKKSKPSREADLQKAHKREFRIPFFRLPPDNLMKSDITNTVGAPRLCLQHAQILGHPGQSTEHSSPAKSRISGSVLGHHSHRVWVVLCGARGLVWDPGGSLPTQDVLWFHCSVSAAPSQIPPSCPTICIANLGTTGALLFSLQALFYAAGGWGWL